MNKATKTWVIIGVTLIAVGLVSFASPFPLQWLATIGLICLVIAFFSHRGHKRELLRQRRLRGE